MELSTDQQQQPGPTLPSTAPTLPSTAPLDARSIALSGILLLAVLYTLFFARSFIVPLVLVFLLGGPPAHWLESLPLASAVLVTLAVIALSLLALVAAHGAVMPRIDRRFFRESYDTQRILADIGSAAREARGVEDEIRGWCGARRERRAFHHLDGLGNGAMRVYVDHANRTAANRHPPPAGGALRRLRR